MEAGGKDCEEETLQTAFKKLRVDAESLPGSVSEPLAPRPAPRPCLDSSGVKPKLVCPKDNWHGCMRKSSRAVSRTQRRRRSKSPILHPPKFTYCSTATSPVLSTSSGCLKHQRLTVPESVEPHPAVDVGAAATAGAAAHAELPSSTASGPMSALVFGSCSAAAVEIPAAATTTNALQDGGSSSSSRSRDELGPDKSACDGAEPTTAGLDVRGAADFRALSELHGVSSPDGARSPCSCTRGESGEGAEARCQCQSSQQAWAGVEVYSFTGLRSVISECERDVPSHDDDDDAPRTPSAAAASAAATTASPLSSGSPRSCSEQARAYVDDITIEDLSGYMEYYLYIPKKMSHMAEMMYT
ncbi:uncharacterized protein V6R79_006005 [Siganus canaliculatus]